MSNFLDYLKWRGDLTFEVDPINEVDNLIFSYVTYARVEPVIQKGMSIKEISDAFFSHYTKEELAKDKSLIKDSPLLLEAMAKTKRYQDIRVIDYANIYRPDLVEQFSAWTFEINKKTIYVAYEGTDDTITGWQEDFHMTAGPIPACKDALIYINNTDLTGIETIYVGGHSKGGNLAMYASAYCDQKIRDKIVRIYSNDGPGFNDEVEDIEKYMAIKDRIVRFIPQFSVIGMLMKHIVEPTVIHSSEMLVLQHDGFSWQLMGNQFERAELDEKAVRFNKTLMTWMYNMPIEKRKPFVNEFFSILESTGVHTLTEFQNKGITSNAYHLAKGYNALNFDTKEDALSLVHQLIDEFKPSFDFNYDFSFRIPDFFGSNHPDEEEDSGE